MQPFQRVQTMASAEARLPGTADSSIMVVPAVPCCRPTAEAVMPGMNLWVATILSRQGYQQHLVLAATVAAHGHVTCVQCS